MKRTRWVGIVVVGVAVVVLLACQPVTLPDGWGTTTSTSSTTSTTSTSTSTSTTTTTLPDAPVGRPNILVVMTDDQGCSQHATRLCDQIQSYMPFTRSIVDSSWYVARQAITHNSVCCPNRATYLTGQTNFHNGVLSNNDCKKYDETGYLPLAMQSAGYTTGLFGKYLNCFDYPSKKWPTVPKGWSRMVAHIADPAYYGFDLVEDTGATYTVAQGGPDTYEPYFMAQQAASWLDSLEADDARPWFTYLTVYGPHAPGSACPDADCTTKAFGSVPAPTDLPNFREGCPGATDPDVSDKPSYVQTAKCNAPGRTRNAPLAQLGDDRAFERLYHHLAYLGELDDTVILFVGDNGMSLGSHRIADKDCPWTECHTVPFMLRIPGMPGGDIQRMVSNVDVYSTLADIAGAPILRPQDGSSILPLLSDPTTPWRTDQLLWNGKGTSAYRELRQDCQTPEHLAPNPCWALIEYESGESELYDLNVDPYQLTNLLPNPVTGYAGVLSEADPQVVALRQRLQEAYTAAGGGSWPSG